MATSNRGRALRAVAEAIFYRGTPIASERLDFIEIELSATLAAAGRRARTLFLLCLFGLSVLGPLWVRRFPMLARLPLALRIQALSRMEDSPLGAPLVLAVKAALCIIYYEQPVAAAELRAASACLRVLPSVPETKIEAAS